MSGNVLIYIAVMAVVTYAIRCLPLVLIRREIKNRTLKSFLYYVPYVTLSVMTFPSILEVTDNIYSGLIAFIVALILAYKGKKLLPVAVISCITVLLCELIPLI